MTILDIIAKYNKIFTANKVCKNWYLVRFCGNTGYTVYRKVEYSANVKARAIDVIRVTTAKGIVIDHKQLK